jgi:hypothetical protein
VDPALREQILATIEAARLAIAEAEEVLARREQAKVRAQQVPAS